MNFEHEQQAETHAKVEEYLNELFESPYLDQETGHFFVRYGTTVLEISVEPHGPSEAAVLIVAYCVQGVELREELLLGLLEVNHQLPFGAFSLVGTDIFFSHSLLGRSLDARSLLRIIETVATISDDYDDRIVAKYGGQTAVEKIRGDGKDDGGEEE